MGILVTVAVLISFAVIIDNADAVCCRSRWGLCRDCTIGTPYCGYGRCNIFGCACRGGCRRGRCFREDEGELDATTLFNIYDLNRNGGIENDEFTAAFTHLVLTEGEWAAQWNRMDKNKDGIISMDEFDY